MKNNKGFAPILVIVAVAVVGGGVYALLTRTTVKSFFERGDKPTESQFNNLIDSTVHMQEDRNDLGLKEQKPTKAYVAGDTAVKSETIYQAKVVTQDQREFKLDAAQPVTFRWTPIVPKPQEPVAYRLKVWQLMQGQNGAQAMKANQPIVTKDVADITEATVSGIYTGPCRPPYLCDFVWDVEARAASPIGTGTGEIATSTPEGAPGTSLNPDAPHQ